VKVWIYRGDVLPERRRPPADGAARGRGGADTIVLPSRQPRVVVQQRRPAEGDGAGGREGGAESDERTSRAPAE
jgi:hypothetical protein